MLIKSITLTPPDGKYFFFTREDNIYKVDANVIDVLSYD